MYESIFPMNRRSEVDPELAALGVDRIEVVAAHGGLLEIVCARVDGEWAMVGVWAGDEHVQFEPVGLVN